MIRTVQVSLLVLLTTVVGCAENQVPLTSDFYDFTGTVTVQGKPADRVSLNLTPADPAIGREQVCLVTQGKYDLKKVMAGRYKVSFTSAGGTAIPRQYQLPTTSGFALDASSKGGEQTFDLK
jgi:hypothetical protein